MTKHNITAIIYDKRGRVLSVGKNSYVKSHPIQKQHAIKNNLPHKIFLHGEIDAIIKCPDISKAYKISIFRLTKSGEYGLSKPCTICASAISKTPIKIIEHT